jgi:type IV pilus assembly protein PilQ
MRGGALGFSDYKDKSGPALSALFFLTILLAAMFYACPGAASESGRITNIEISDYSVEVRADRPIKYSILKSDDPFRFTVMLEGITAGDFKNRIFSRSAGITEITPSFTETPVPASRLEILLQTPSVVKPEVSGNVLTLSLDHDPAEQPDAAITGSADDSGDIEMASAIKEVLLDKKDGGLEIVLKTDGTAPEPSVFEVDGGLVIDIPDIVMEATLPKGFASPLKGLRFRKEKNGIRLVVDTESGYNSDVYSLDDEIIIDISSAFMTKKQGEGASVSQSAGVPMPESKGNQLVSLDFQDGDIVPILRLLADVSGYNIVVHPDVRGKITMKLLNVKWDQALDLVLKTFSLEKLIDGNIIRIAPVKIFQEERRITAEKKEDSGKAEDITTKVFRVNYSTVESVETFINKAKVLSPRGSISSDSRTRSLIIKDITSSIVEVEKLISTLDKPTPQVIIDARIVEADVDNTRNLGIEWGAKWLSSDGRFGMAGSSPGSIANTLGTVSPIVSLPAGAVAGALTLGYLNPKQAIGLDIRLSAFENAGLVKIISQPHIMTIENEAATIVHGASIPVTTAGSANAPPTTSYLSADLRLNVKPTVTPDESVFLEIDITNDNPNYALRDPLTGNVPIDKRQAKTKVLIKDGATLVIGGIAKSTESDSQGGVPFLSKIPGLGWLFKNQSKTKSSSEVLIFITPRIVRTQ